MTDRFKPQRYWVVGVAAGCMVMATALAYAGGAWHLRTPEADDTIVTPRSAEQSKTADDPDRLFVPSPKRESPVPGDISPTRPRVTPRPEPRPPAARGETEDEEEDHETVEPEIREDERDEADEEDE